MWFRVRSVDEDNVVLDTVKRGQGTAFSAIIKKLIFWVKLLDEGKEVILKIASSGGSVNDVQGYALSGAITNAIGKAASNIGFQQKSVYLGARSINMEWSSRNLFTTAARIRKGGASRQKASSSCQTCGTGSQASAKDTGTDRR